jgi:hypothetical protein
MDDRRPRTGKDIILLWLRNTVGSLVLFLLVSYVFDYAILRFRMATNRSAFGSVTVRPVYAVPKKNHSTEFLAGDPQEQTCVHSLFPHANDWPCWYLTRHKEQEIDM